MLNPPSDPEGYKPKPWGVVGTIKRAAYSCDKPSGPEIYGLSIEAAVEMIQVVTAIFFSKKLHHNIEERDAYRDSIISAAFVQWQRWTRCSTSEAYDRLLTEEGRYDYWWWFGYWPEGFLYLPETVPLPLSIYEEDWSLPEAEDIVTEFYEIKEGLEESIRRMVDEERHAWLDNDYISEKEVRDKAKSARFGLKNLFKRCNDLKSRIPLKIRMA